LGLWDYFIKFWAWVGKLFPGNLEFGENFTLTKIGFKTFLKRGQRVKNPISTFYVELIKFFLTKELIF